MCFLCVKCVAGAWGVNTEDDQPRAEWNESYVGARAVPPCSRSVGPNVTVWVGVLWWWLNEPQKEGMHVFHKEESPTLSRQWVIEQRRARKNT